MRHKWMLRIISNILVLVVLTGSFSSAQTFQAASSTLSLTQAKAMALANSDSYNRIKSRISLKEVSYKQAVKSIQLKIKNKTTFRWTPVLSFKFPEKLNFEDESNMVYKPAQIQNDITNMKHDLVDEVFGIYESTEQAFLKVYICQETVAFEEERLGELEKTLEKNKGRLLLGLATQSDVESIEKNLESVKQKLAQDKKNFENAKEKLSDLVHIDVTTRYNFAEPYITAEIPRSEVESLVTYTLANDQSYYEAKMATQLCLLQLDANYGLLKNQYGSKMNLISSYIQQVKNGQKIDSAAFKISYDKFLQKIDEPNGELKLVARALLPSEIVEGTQLKYEMMQYEIVN